MRQVGLTLATLFLAAALAAAAEPPVAILDGPIQVTVDTPVTLSADSSFVPDGKLEKFSIELGDGRTVSKKEVTHTFTKAGKYTVKLTVTDKHGNKAEAVKTITVRPKTDTAVRSVSSQCGLVVAMVENGGKTAYARFVEGTGPLLMGPFTQRNYADVTFLSGTDCTTERFFEAIRKSAAKHQAVDVVIFAHGATNKFWLGSGSIPAKQIVTELKGRGGDRVRMVYSTTCYGQSLVDNWREAGAHAVLGAKGFNRPLDFPSFWIAWISGKEFRTSVMLGHKANQDVHGIVNRYGSDMEEALDGLSNLTRGLEDKVFGGHQPQLSEARDVLSKLKGFLPKKSSKKKTWDIDSSRPFVDGDSVTIDCLPARVEE